MNKARARNSHLILLLPSLLVLFYFCHSKKHAEPRETARIVQVQKAQIAPDKRTDLQIRIFGARIPAFVFEIKIEERLILKILTNPADRDFILKTDVFYRFHASGLHDPLAIA